MKFGRANAAPFFEKRGKTRHPPLKGKMHDMKTVNECTTEETKLPVQMNWKKGFLKVLIQGISSFITHRLKTDTQFTNNVFEAKVSSFRHTVKRNTAIKAKENFQVTGRNNRARFVNLFREQISTGS